MGCAMTDRADVLAESQGMADVPLSDVAPVGVDGDVTYRCPRDGHEWECRGTLIAGQVDPAAHGRGDDCPRCGRECDQVVDFEPDDYQAYQALSDYEEARCGL